jgi:protein phosphatase
MQTQTKLIYDVASALALGQRDQQEDAVIADFPQGGDIGFAVLADGMGGHAAGDLASKIVVTEVFSELKLQSGDVEQLELNMPAILRGAVDVANQGVRYHTDSNPASYGMGATIVAPVLLDDRLYWISVGDSPLYLYRNGLLTQLNEDHSLASQIDMMAAKGMMSTEAAENHPDRHCLTSVLIGDEIPKIDCPETPVMLRENDIIIAASDGLQFLDNDEITSLVSEYARDGSGEITRQLLAALDALGDPHQDNTSICVIRVHAADQGLRSPVRDIRERMTPLEPVFERDIQPPPEIVAAAQLTGGTKLHQMARRMAHGFSSMTSARKTMEKSA